MEREFYQELINWKKFHILTPFMVVGARQVGKTYVINQFCKDNFDDYIYINLLENVNVVNIFEDKINIIDKIEKFKKVIHREIKEDTVIFFDEIQESEELISSLKYFCEDKFPYKIVCAGSLLGVKLNRFHSSFPVGKVLISHMYPMSFKEFLMAIGKKNYIPLIEECYVENKAMVSSFHEELINDFRTFLCIGGMPKVVEEYVSNKDFINNKFLLNTIIESYIADMKKYTLNIYESLKIERMYNSIPSQLAKENKKFQFSKVEKSARLRDYETALSWLIASLQVIPCYNTIKQEIPLKAYIDNTSFKLYMNDLGLLVSLVDLDYSNIINNDNFMYKGALVENYVALELIKNNYNLYYYNKPQVMEIDFLINNKNMIIPIEVKANDNVRSTSLNKFISKKRVDYGIRISTKNFGLENNIKSVPLYAVFCIK